jgi:hypothetical protein
MPNGSVQKQAQAMGLPGRSELWWKLKQMSDVQLVTLPSPLPVFYTGMWLACVEGVGCMRCCAMSAALVPSSVRRLVTVADAFLGMVNMDVASSSSSCNQVCGMCAHQLSEHHS